MGNSQPKKLSELDLRERRYLEEDEEAERRGASIAICYHPADQEFVTRLNNALTNAGRRVIARWDAEEPEATPEWLDGVHRAIESHDVLLYVVSPDSIASELCNWEVDHAATCRKRIIPVEYREVDPNDVRPEVRESNFVFMTDDDPGSFANGLKLLCKLADADIRHLRMHTQLLVRAVQWEAVYGRNKKLLLRGEDKRRANAFLTACATGTSPHPAAVTLSFASRSIARGGPSCDPRTPESGYIRKERFAGAGAGGAAPVEVPDVDDEDATDEERARAAKELEESVASVFVSFAQEDAEFARQLVEALREHTPHRRVLAHFEERDESRECFDAVNRDIQQADVFVTLVSPDSLTSEATNWDVDHAVRCGKRVVPVVVRKVDLRTIRAELARLKWIFFDGSLGSFENVVLRLVARADVDVPHMVYHCRILAYAIMWLQHDRASRFLLKGGDITGSVDWASAAALGKGPHAVPVQIEYLNACVASKHKPGVWAAVCVREVEHMAHLPIDPTLPVMFRDQWKLEGDLNQELMAEARATPPLESRSASEESIFLPADDDDDNNDGSAAAGGDSQNRHWAPPAQFDDDNEDAMIDQLL